MVSMYLVLMHLQNFTPIAYSRKYTDDFICPQLPYEMGIIISFMTQFLRFIDFFKFTQLVECKAKMLNQDSLIIESIFFL